MEKGKGGGGECRQGHLLGEQRWNVVGDGLLFLFFFSCSYILCISATSGAEIHFVTGQGNILYPRNDSIRRSATW